MTQTPSLTCSDRSRSADEPLYGTMTQAEVWLLLEYDRPWGAKAFEESEIPQQVKEHLLASGGKIMLIRQPGQIGARDTRISFFVIAASQNPPRRYDFQLDHYEDLLELNFEAILGENEAFALDAPMFLVCANGKRDACCARHGVTLYNALAEVAGDAVWQCTHLGGHRFAPTMVCFPHAVGYGRVTPADAARIVDSYTAGEVLPEFYRGRAIYPEAVQAAEYFLMRQNASSHLLQLESAEQDGDCWHVRFRDLSGAVYSIELVRREHPQPVLKSCIDSAPSSVFVYELLGATANHPL